MRSLLVTLLYFATSASAANIDFPSPDPNASKACSERQFESARNAWSKTGDVVACFLVQRYVFQGIGLVFVVPPDVAATDGIKQFSELRKAIFRDQSVRLRAHRNMSEAMPGKPPAHGTIPASLKIEHVTPLGVFTEGPDHIGFADLLPNSATPSPQSPHLQYPYLQLESYIRRENGIYKLVVTSIVAGPETIARGYALAENWAQLAASHSK
jgi:hypothetical protein